MCGFVGMIGLDNASRHVATALQAIQHRGQDAAGIGTKKGNHFRLYKDLGLVHTIFSEDDLKRLEGSTAVGHVRYPTMGSASKEDAQPFYSRWPGIIMAHNGNIMNFEEMKKYLLDQSNYLSSRCDIEPVLYVLSGEIMKGNGKPKASYTVEDVLRGMAETYRITKGAYSIVGIMNMEGEDTLFVARDAFGIRPAMWGRKGDAYMVASESVCMDVLDFDTVGSVAPGEVIFFRPGKEPLRETIDYKGKRPCIFEYIYFARPDSRINEDDVYQVRLKLGELLAEEWEERRGYELDVVMPIPDTARPSTIMFSEKVGVPVREGFIKNRYSGRTFIMGNQGARKSALRLKLNPIDAEVRGRRILLIDDSIVRGNTLKQIVSTLEYKEPKEIHLAIYSPPVIHPCFYGIDMSTREELAAYQMMKELGLEGESFEGENLEQLEERMARELGVTSLTFLSVGRLNRVFGKERCAACFDGDYPVPIPEDVKQSIVRDRILHRGESSEG